MRSLIARHKGLFGVDIGSASVKMVELSRNNGRFRVESCALEALPAEAVIERHISDVGKVGEALGRAHARSRSRARRVAVAVGGPALIAKRIVLDASLDDAALLERITADASRYIPFPIDEVAIDFEVLGLSEGQPDQADVLLVACRRVSVDGLRAVLLSAGLEPVVVEPQGQAIERVFDLLAPQIERQAGELVVAIADVGASVVALWILVDGRAIFSREQPLGNERLVPAAMQADTEAFAGLGGSGAGTAGARQSSGHNGHTSPDDLSSTDAAVLGLCRLLRYFYSSGHYSDIDGVVLIGDAAATPGLKEALQDALAVTVVVANPFAKLAVAASVDAGLLSENAAALTLCCGLAMRSGA